jgi:hypothetical protein
MQIPRAELDQQDFSATSTRIAGLGRSLNSRPLASSQLHEASLARNRSANRYGTETIQEPRLHGCAQPAALRRCGLHDGIAGSAEEAGKGVGIRSGVAEGGNVPLPWLSTLMSQYPLPSAVAAKPFTHINRSQTAGRAR